MILQPGTIKRIHVDKQVIAQNRIYGRNDPAITVQTSKGPIKARSVKVFGKSEMIYRPEKPLSCGARAWLETKARCKVVS